MQKARRNEKENDLWVNFDHRPLVQTYYAKLISVLLCVALYTLTLIIKYMSTISTSLNIKNKLSFF